MLYCFWSYGMISKIRGNPTLVSATLSGGVFAFSTFVGLVAALLVDLSRDLGTTVATIGQLATITSISWAISAPLVGPLSDRIGPRRILTAGLLIFGASAIGYGISHAFWTLIVSSVLAGLGGAMVGPSILASVADHYSSNTLGRAMAAANVANSVAYLVGVPGAVLIAGSLGWRWSFLSVAAVFLICFMAVVTILPVSRPHRSNQSATYMSRFAEAFGDKTFLPMVIANTIFQGAYWVVGTYLAAFLVLSHTLNTSQLAPLISAMAVGQLVGMVAGGRLADRYDKLKICLLSSVLLGMTGLAFIVFNQNVWLSVFWGALFMGFWGLSRPAYFSLMALVSSTVRGTVMGVQATSNHLGRALGAAVGGLVLSLSGYNLLGILCLILSIAGMAMYLRLSLFSRK